MRVVRLAAIIAWSALAVVLGLAPAAADKRVALVVGNGTYQFVGRLANPRNDAELMAKTLKSLGFTLIGDRAQIDLDKAGLDKAVQSFGAQLQGADVGLFYYAGHGVQVRGANYLVPVSANPTKEADVDFQMLDANVVLRQMEGSGTKLNVVILDACRNNPFGGRGLRAVSRGLAQMQAPEGTIISYATQPDSVAQDGTDGDSPYTKALARTIQQRGLDIFQTFNEVGLAVVEATNNAQQPWLSSSPIKGKFYFAGEIPTPVSTGPNKFDGAWTITRSGPNCRESTYQFVVVIEKAAVSGFAGRGKLTGSITTDGNIIFNHPSSPGPGRHDYVGVLQGETGSGKFDPYAKAGKCTGTFVAKRN